MKSLAPIVVIAIGVLLLFAGPQAASTEESAANAVGNFIQNRWVAFGVILVGALLFAHDEGYLKA